VHPNLLTQHVVLQVEEPVFGTITPFKLNNFFEIIMLARIYLLYNALIEISIYCTPRAHRMCRIYNSKNSVDFGIKSVFNAFPLTCLLVLFVTLTQILSRMLMLSE
jgi:hypothetical protein